MEDRDAEPGADQQDALARNTVPGNAADALASRKLSDRSSMSLGKL